MWKGAVVVLIALGAGGCSERNSSEGIPVVEADSAGIPLYRLTELPPWSAPSFLWSVELEHSFDTRARSGSAEPVIYQPQGYTRMRSGELVVLDGGEHRLVVADPGTGEVQARFAPSGQGPGEIWSSNAALWPAGDDSFWVLDPGNVRLSRFSLVGELLEERSVGMTGMGGFTVQRVGSGEPWSWRVFLEDRATGILRDSVGRFNPDLAELEFVAALPDRPESALRNSSTRVLFDAMGWFAPVRDGVVVGRNDGGRFRLYSAGGEVSALLEVPMDQRPIDVTEEAAILEEFLGVTRDSPDRSRPEIADAYPLYNTLWQVNDTLFALQQGYRSTPEGEPRIPDGQFVWRVFTLRGRYGGTIVFPPGVALPFWVEDGSITATHRDEFGVATIQTFRVEPPS